jgi:hypothetical protein
MAGLAGWSQQLETVEHDAGEDFGDYSDFMLAQQMPFLPIEDDLMLAQQRPSLPLGGDPYAHHFEEVIRGVTLPAPGISDVYGGCHGLDSVKFDSDRESRFEKGTAAPSLPSDSLFGLAVTSFELPGVSPVEAGNRCLSMPQEGKCTAIILKVNFRKFTIKATAFVHGLSCEFKVFIYSMRHPQEGAIVELQRRSGDGIAFNQFFQVVRAQLATEEFRQTQIGFMPGVLHAGWCNATDFECGAPTLDPLLDMACHCGCDTEMQAEAASALHRTVEDDSRLAEHLCTALGHLALESLLKSDHVRVAYPTARLLSAISRCPHVVELFGERVYPQIFPLVLTKLRAGSTSRIIKKELAESLRRFVQNCQDPLVNSCAAELASELEDFRSYGEARCSPSDFPTCTVQNACVVVR